MKDLMKQIQEFLAERRLEDGGWAEVKQEDIEQLSEIIWELINLKFEKDVDGDLPVNFRLANRNIERFLYPVKVPYQSDENNPFGHNGKLDLLTRAITTYGEELESEIRYLRD